MSFLPCTCFTGPWLSKPDWRHSQIQSWDWAALNEPPEKELKPVNVKITDYIMKLDYCKLQISGLVWELLPWCKKKSQTCVDSYLDKLLRAIVLGWKSMLDAKDQTCWNSLQILKYFSFKGLGNLIWIHLQRYVCFPQKAVNSFYSLAKNCVNPHEFALLGAVTNIVILNFWFVVEKGT